MTYTEVAALLLQADRLLSSRNLEGAIEHLRQAESLGANPDHCAGRLWTCHMLAGDYELAWQQSDAIRLRGTPDPHRVWDGTTLAGHHVMVRSIHGLGDAVQMLRYAPLIRSLAKRLTVQVAPSLIDLARCVEGIDEVVAWGDERSYDVQLEVTELPYVFRSTLDNLPRAIPYLHLPPHSKSEARSILGTKIRPRVGFVWSSSTWDSSRSIPFASLQPLLLERDHIDLWCLQPNAPEWDQLCQQQQRPAYHAGNYSAMTFAACVAQMDLVITTDSFAAHLAGALGTPAWVLLKCQADWRWLVAREDSPWYPPLRLFRQPVDGDWKTAIVRVKAQLLEWQSDKSSNLEAAHRAKIAEHLV